jgi:hypothetical protein
VGAEGRELVAVFMESGDGADVDHGLSLAAGQAHRASPVDRETTGSIPSRTKNVASDIFIDYGIIDSITDMRREYPASFVIPMPRQEPPATAAPAPEPTAAPTAPGTTTPN